MNRVDSIQNHTTDNRTMPAFSSKNSVDAENNRNQIELSQAMAPLSLEITDPWDSAANEIRK